MELRWKRIFVDVGNEAVPKNAIFVDGVTVTEYKVLQCRSLEGPLGEQWESDWADIPYVE